MKRTLNLLLVVLAMNAFAQPNLNWNPKQEQIHNQHRNDASTWNTELLEVDKQIPPSLIQPMAVGAFPVPNYELANNEFQGVASGGEWSGIEIGDKKAVYLNMQYALGEEQTQTQVFFSIVVLTDSIAADGYSHAELFVNSRNHPHYSGEGFVLTKTNPVEFIAFETADHNAYALVNMRLFDLRIGRVVLIAPQTDGSFRSLQLSTKANSPGEMDSYIKELLRSDKQVKEFFQAEGAI
ncbi:hypothetical protein HZ996_05850 [Cryomorphaceae bacterium]|nr:hypothetical protein HZ996_05850 [Cryomorphaceae bacterium]